MRALDRKLLRDLWQIRGQVLAIALVIATGIMIFVMYLSVFGSLRGTQAAYYDAYRFGDVFASLKRAPQSLAVRIAGIPGVAQVETRAVAGVTLDVPGMEEPALGRLISIPERRRPMLCDLFLRQGRYPEAARPDEVLVSEGFALAHGLGPGDRVPALINGRRRALEIVGVALSPEYIYAIAPGDLIPDAARFGVFWMGRRALATAFDMEGGFNDVVLKLSRGASSAEVIARLDALLAPYGGLGAIPRDLQISHWTLENELRGLQGAGLVVPILFLMVAAFLLNVVLVRIVTVQREQVAALKALGYSSAEIGRHYAGWSLVISLLGTVIGIVGGGLLGTAMMQMYNQFFRFPFLEYRVPPWVAMVAAGIGIIAALLGARGAVRRAAALPPAEAMRPPAPGIYRVSLGERLGLGRLLSEPGRMILRNLERQPVRAGLSILGIALATALPVAGTFFIDSLDVLMGMQFQVIQRQDVSVSFVEPTSAKALYSVARLPGVLDAEPFRAVSARLVHGHRQRQVGITGVTDSARLQRVVDVSLAEVHLPPEGLVLSKELAELLAIERGDRVRLEILEGARPVRELPVVDLVEEYMGTSAYMDAGALRRLLREGRSLSGAHLEVDPGALGELYRRLKALPAVAAVTIKGAALKSMWESFGRNIRIMIAFNLLFGGIIAFGVVYNAARVSLSERSHELASLRILGFTRAEISLILLGELALLTLVALPIGLLLGTLMAHGIVPAFDNELLRFPAVIYPSTYARAVIAILLSALVSGWIVRRKLDRLDLVEVLKTKG